MHSLIARAALRPTTLAVGVLVLGFAAFQVHAAVTAPKYWKQGYVHFLEADGFLYSFDAAWRVESLRVSSAPGTPAGNPEREAKMRRVLLGRMGVSNLDSIPVEGKREMDAIRALGYL